MNIKYKLDPSDLTYDVGFKFILKNNRTKWYSATIISEILKLPLTYVINNMHYLDVELVQDLKSLVRSDVIIEVNNTILILEMNRQYVSNYVELKLRYSNYLFNKLFYSKENLFSKKKIILVLINA